MKRHIERIKRRVPQSIKARIKPMVSKSPLAHKAAAAQVPFRFSIDSPVASTSQQPIVSVEGWILPTGHQVLKAMRVRYGDVVKAVPFGLKRPDVQRAFPDDPQSLPSGFSVELEITDDMLALEIDYGQGFEKIYEIHLRYSPELLVQDYYNPRLAENMAEHLNLIDNKKRYFWEKQAPAYHASGDAPRLVAFYLPQFHPIAENDYVWGKNFTEWTNVTTDIPRFAGHVQPFLPSDSGFYDLRLEQTMHDQIELAKHHGIYGFCFYYYWFSGRRLLEKPLDVFLDQPDWNFNFSICWANENWTKRWDGRDHEVIVAQKYAESDPLDFIKDVEHILLDPRYIQEDGKPVLTVFRASELKDPARYAKVWREYFRKKHKRELHLVAILSFENVDPRTYGFDAALDFAPQSAFFKNECFEGSKYPYVDVSERLLDSNFTGSVADYRAIALNEKCYEFFDFPTYKCVTPSWDNDARKKGSGFVMHNQSPDIYAKWLDNILKLETKSSPSPLVFINAWNEWAEGAVLEPSRHYGHAVLNRTTEKLQKYAAHVPADMTMYGINRSQSTRLAVVIHLYYPETWPQIRAKLKHITEPYDLFVSLNKKDENFGSEIAKFNKAAHVMVLPNRGRDVLPFLHLARRLDEAGYEYVLKLHSKRSVHRQDGNVWFDDVLNQLIPADAAAQQQIQTTLLDGQKTLVGPKNHVVSLARHMGSNEQSLQGLLGKIYGADASAKMIKQKAEYNYFAGTMFWASLPKLRPILNLSLLPEDFDAERGQIDGTLAHAVERLFGVLAQRQDGGLYEVSRQGVAKAPHISADQKYDFAP